MSKRPLRHTVWEFPGLLEPFTSEGGVRIPLPNSTLSCLHDPKCKEVVPRTPWFYAREGSRVSVRVSAPSLTDLYEFSSMFEGQWVSVEHSPMLDARALFYLMSGYVVGNRYREVLVDGRLEDTPILRKSSGSLTKPRVANRDCTKSNRMELRIGDFSMAGKMEKFLALQEDMAHLKALMDQHKVAKRNPFPTIYQ